MPLAGFVLRERLGQTECAADKMVTERSTEPLFLS